MRLNYEKHSKSYLRSVAPHLNNKTVTPLHPSTYIYYKLPFVGTFSLYAQNRPNNVTSRFCKKDTRINLIFTPFKIASTIIHKNNGTNGKICAKVAFPRYTESVKCESAKLRGLRGYVGRVGAWVAWVRGLRGLRGSKSCVGRVGYVGL